MNFNQTEAESSELRMETLCKDAGREPGQVGKGTAEDEMAGRHHRLDAHEFE